MAPVLGPFLQFPSLTLCKAAKKDVPRRIGSLPPPAGLSEKRSWGVGKNSFFSLILTPLSPYRLTTLSGDGFPQIYVLLPLLILRRPVRKDRWRSLLLTLPPEFELFPRGHKTPFSILFSLNTHRDIGRALQPRKE